MVVTLTTHTNKLRLFRHTNHSETSCCSRRVCTSSGASPSGSDSGSNWYGWMLWLASQRYIHHKTLARATASVSAPSPWKGHVAGKAGVDRRSSLAFKDAGTETACSQKSSLERLLDSWNSGPQMSLGQCILNTVLLELWQLCEIDENSIMWDLYQTNLQP